MRRAPAKRGFTLVELLAALALIGIALPVLLHAITTASRMTSVAKRKTEATTLAQGKVEELVATRAWQSGQMSGDFGENFPEYRWSAALANWDATTMQELDVTVTWSLGAREMSIKLSTLVDTGTN